MTCSNLVVCDGQLRVSASILSAAGSIPASSNPQKRRTE